ncbi:MAG: adenine phosphoribosyltransferase [Prochlorococcus marinus CUG1431]|uniref:Adenine phosphoribosyltransferase n=1 Tax=Prochlorococcus marinus CUG1433 TaxID=2774506 RepID=A0A9D9BWY3_PROMR|nr:adenine phosphoribosyltransferase [Prochlorococcus marinus CUG1433]MBO6981584.1 adenine phosphoribosyltransferase [Prochlorococcus marinus CUG1431]
MVFEKKKVIDLIDTYKDFPKKGIDFKDILGIIQEPKIFKELIVMMSSSEIIKNADAIISIDARGFIFGSAISLESSKPMILARKPGKLPGELSEEKYSLEYGENSLSVQKKALQKYNSYAIVDDLLATGGTVNCVSKLIKSNNKKVTGLLVVVELKDLKGRFKLDFPVDASVCI